MSVLNVFTENLYFIGVCKALKTWYMYCKEHSEQETERDG